jgi:hypothetical protein
MSLPQGALPTAPHPTPRSRRGQLTTRPAPDPAALAGNGKGGSPWSPTAELTARRVMLELLPYSWQGETGDIRDKATGQLLFRRSKTRCADNADWVILENALDGTTAWRVQARYTDRDVRDAQAKGFWTALRVFSGNAEPLPRFMLFYRSESPGAPASACAIDVYQGNVEDPGGAGLAFRLQSNDRQDTVGLFPLYQGDDQRSIAVLRRPPEAQSMSIEVEAGVDLSLLAALLVAADQLLLSHNLRNYDVDWQGDLWLLESCSGTSRPDPSKRSGCLCLVGMK